MVLYGCTIFLSAFLLFQVQPIIGKYILPWFGGSSSVWTTCMLCFQVLLLLGYVYAHVLSTLNSRVRARLHLALLAVSLVFLPIEPDPEIWKPDPAGSPALQIIFLLLANVGVPFLLLSSTAPLLQKWFSLSYPGRSPYRLYAVSNAGSLLALLSYPFIVEPLVTRNQQILSWSWIYAVFALLCGFCSWKISGPFFSRSHVKSHTEDATPGSSAPGLSRMILWLALTGSASAMLLATTNRMTQDIASVPLLWVLPLSIYIVSFILCFAGKFWYNRTVFGLLIAAGAPFVCMALFKNVDMDMVPQIFIFAVALFACCMVCHGELVHLKPEPRYLTLFYLTVAAGGALGGMYVAVIAPIIYDSFWEFHLSYVSCSLLASICWFLNLRNSPPRKTAQTLFVLAGIGQIALMITLGTHILRYDDSTIEMSRNFYGALSVNEQDSNKLSRRRELFHGNISHGTQYLHEKNRHLPVSYYSRKSGVGLALTRHPRRQQGSIRVGAIGLGVGTIAAFGKKGDYFRFYEINPDVDRMARKFFTYLADSEAEIEVVFGDGRIRIQDEIRSGCTKKFDVLVVDAFSGDAIPNHLLTAEAADLYWQILNPDGLLAFHLSNRFVALEPVVIGLARKTQSNIAIINTGQDKRVGQSSATWAILAKDNDEFFMAIDMKETEGPGGAPSEGDHESILWTDDFTSVFQILE